MTGELVAWAASAAGPVLLHALRLLPAAVLSPALGGPLLPPSTRAALAFGLGACAWAAAGAPAAAQDAAFAVAAAREGARGVAFGLFAALPFEVARAAGRLADTARGATLAELHVAPLRQHETAVGDLLVQWTVVLAAVSGGGRLVVAALLGTFRAVPAGAPLAEGPLLAAVLQGASALVADAVCLGAPAAAGVLAADLALALALRGAPGIGVVAAAQPARAALGLASLAVASSALAGRLTSAIALSAALVGAEGRP